MHTSIHIKMEEASLSDIYKHPLVQDLIKENEGLRDQAQLDGTKIPDSKIENVKVPYKIENRLLMQAGEFNGVVYPREEIESKLDDMVGKPLMLDHRDTQQEGASAWVGEIQNVHWDTGEQGEGVYGDLIIIDKPIAQKLAYGAKWGISPTIDYEKNELDGKVVGTDLLFKSFSFVITPAVRDTMLNSALEVDKLDEQKLAQGKGSPEEGADKLAGQTLPYKYPYKENNKELELDVSEKILGILKKRDEQISELSKFKDKIELSEKESLVSGLVANEFLIGRISEGELEERTKHLMDKTSEVLSELQEVVGAHSELASFQQFVKTYLKKNPDKTIADASKAWKAGKGNLEEDSEDDGEAKEGEAKPEEKPQEQSLTAPDSSVSKKTAELMEKNPKIGCLDVEMYNWMAGKTPGGIKI